MFKTITRTLNQIPDTTCGAYRITNECRVFELHLIGTTSVAYKSCIWNRVFSNIIKNILSIMFVKLWILQKKSYVI